jgi:hypothetical protein
MRFETITGGFDPLAKIAEWLDPFAPNAPTEALVAEKRDPILFEDWAPLAFGALFVIGDALLQIFG